MTDRIQRKSLPNEKKVREYQVGDKVMVRDYRGSKVSWMQENIARKLGPVTYRVNICSMMLKRHIDQIRECDVMCELGSSVKPNPFNSTVPVSVLIPTRSEPSNSSSITVVPSCKDTVCNEPCVSNDSKPSVEDARNLDTNSVQPRYPRRQHHKPERLIETC